MGGGAPGGGAGPPPSICGMSAKRYDLQTKCMRNAGRVFVGRRAPGPVSWGLLPAVPAALATHAHGFILSKGFNDLRGDQARILPSGRTLRWRKNECQYRLPPAALWRDAMLSGGEE